MSSDHVVLRRHTSDIRAQYVHAVYSTVQIDGENDIQQDVDIAIDPSLLAPLPPVPSQFGSERRVLDHIQLRQTKMASELEARERKREIYVQNRMRREAVERAKKEEEDRVAATRAASQLAQEELRRKQQEEDRAKQDQHLLRSLNAEKAIILRHFDGVVGIESDLKVRVSFLESHDSGLSGIWNRLSLPSSNMKEISQTFHRHPLLSSLHQRRRRRKLISSSNFPVTMSKQPNST
uniref:Uncharacterized protein n=1 Tax=Spongospora subterranea TaxID=70186 RepID=A0A0H5R897_9EUKA|eukprot:CRZ10355.1 hypothetical protein [Spongospora subterranea]